MIGVEIERLVGFNPAAVAPAGRPVNLQVFFWTEGPGVAFETASRSSGYEGRVDAGG